MASQSALVLGVAMYQVVSTPTGSPINFASYVAADAAADAGSPVLPSAEAAPQTAHQGLSYAFAALILPRFHHPAEPSNACCFFASTE